MHNYRIIIITQGVSKIVKPIVNNCNVVGIIESASRKKRCEKKQKGLFRFILKLLFVLVKLYRRRDSLKWFSRKNNIPYFYMNNGCDAEMEEWTRNLNPDLIVVHSMSQLLKPNIIDIPKYKPINLHMSYLPNFPGPNALFWEYYYMEKNCGVTVHFIDEGEDTGSIIFQERVSIPRGIRKNNLYEICIQKGIPLLLRAIMQIDRIVPIDQNRVSKLNRARHINISEYPDLIEWERWSLAELFHFLRGTEDYFNKVYSKKRGVTYKIKGYEKYRLEGQYEYGKLYTVNKLCFLVTKEGRILCDQKFSLKKYLVSYVC